MSFISLDIAAALTGVSKRTLWRRIAAGTLTASRGGGAAAELTRVSLAEIAPWAAFDLSAEDLECVRAADEGDVDAQCDFGLLLLANQQAAEALNWFEKASRHFHADAMHWLGRCLIAGRGAAADREAGIGWLRRAAARGRHPTVGHMVAWLDAHPEATLTGEELEAVFDRIEREIMLESVQG
ncbi:MAG: hypothetical protein RBR77_09500 [Thauera sp.]|nr:hypothetical protein [Thauera sp.]